MKLCSLASGSSGNCTYVAGEKTQVLIDAGISCRRIEQALSGEGVQMKELDGILVTHEHSDHISALGVLSRKYHIPLYMTGGTADAVARAGSLGKVDRSLIHEIREDEPFSLGDLCVTAFSIPHDAAQPVGYRIDCGQRSAAVATDMGRYSDYLIDHLTGLDAVLVESNHDLNMLQVGPYPYQLKLRIMGDRGHLSNENAGRLLTRILHDNMKHVILGHLSRENNYDALAYETVCCEINQGSCPYQSRDFDIQVAAPDKPTRMLTF